ncbi:putative RNA-binding protein Nob1p involved in 26S proteasome assembly [Pseudoloma neurophilia]|uniref:Putative RNA-binding protein Nob1p involved in 26S proteasome assembly n=1 Tax=Pseudoloma neurophilia TaxID=146866 RepID=A0A0R0LS08_9MICR|nr:putative RNA-binding protein Nob1p involved in 26S proteasome assembly [Pseudoloma neurophilia]
MYAILDTNIIIDRKIDNFNFVKGYITPSIVSEIKTDDLRQYLNIYMYKIEVKEPLKKYVEKVHRLQKENNLLLSNADIDIIALTIEIKEYFYEQKFDQWISKKSLENDVKCLSRDKGVLQCLKLFSKISEGFKKEFMFRCASCFSLFNSQLDFCKKCASNMISRVSISRINGKVKVYLKKGYVNRPKVLKDKYGNVLRSADQKEYIFHMKEMNNLEK